VHQDLVHREPVEPRRKGRLATKASNFAKELNAPIMTLVELLKGGHVALSGTLSQTVIGCSCFGFGCGHVFVKLAPGVKKYLQLMSQIKHATERISRSGKFEPRDLPKSA
jgi:hypothetical protein